MTDNNKNNNTKNYTRNKLDKLINNLIVVSAVISLLIFLIDFSGFIKNWLVAYLFYFSIPLGCLFLLMIHHLFNSTWISPIRRILEQIAVLFVPLSILFAPILIGFDWMFSLENSGVSSGVIISHKANFTFYLASIYILSALIFISHKLRYWSLKQDEIESDEQIKKMIIYSTGGLILYVIAVTSAAFYWIMYLQKNWFSGIFGFYYFASSMQASMCCLYLIVFILRSEEQFVKYLSKKHFNYLAILILTFTLIYAYIVYSQYIILWSPNLHKEISWFSNRQNGLWGYFTGALITGRIIIPFFALLHYKYRTQKYIILPVCIAVLLTHYIEITNNIMPVFYNKQLPLLVVLQGVSILILIGSILTKYFINQFYRHSLVAINDYKLKYATIEEDISAISGGEIEDINSTSNVK